MIFAKNALSLCGGITARIFDYQDSHNEKQFDDLLRMLRDVLQNRQPTN